MQPTGNNAHSFRLATVGGIGAILLWSTTVAIVRSLSEQIGPLTAAAGVFAVSAIAALIPLLLNRRRRQGVLHLPRLYLMVCGALFVGYMILLFFAIGKAQNRQQALEVALLNYLWPTLTLLFSLPILGKKANWLLLPGTVLALAGVFMVATIGGSLSWSSFIHNLAAHPAAYIMAILAAVFWALYSDLTRKLAGASQEGGVAVFLILSAVVLFIICLFAGEKRLWSEKAWLEMLFLGLSTFVAYSLWDNAMRKGHIVFVAACSYATPLFSTLVSSMYLAVVPGARLWLGCGLLVLGSILSWRSIADLD